MDVLIDRRELLEKARTRNLPLTIVDKDYVLGWLLFGLSRISDLVFKGGTALSKIYFPEIWRLSEDLDFVFLGSDFGEIVDSLGTVFSVIQEKSGISMNLKSEYSNPEYLQLKIQYSGLIGKNWAKLDMTREAPIDEVIEKSIHRDYSDYPHFRTRVETIEEILAQKLRSVLERGKSRDYYDVWRLMELHVHLDSVKEMFERKCRYKEIEFGGVESFFPEDIVETLKPYWDLSLGRLIQPLPDVEVVIDELQSKLHSLFT